MFQRTLAFGVLSASVAPFAYEHATASFSFLFSFESAFALGMLPAEPPLRDPLELRWLLCVPLEPEPLELLEELRPPFFFLLLLLPFPPPFPGGTGI